MNPSIVKIIDMMFRGVPSTPETAAIREELLTNSQARYDDLVAGGYSADVALQQVLESLRGMEEVLDEYRTPHPTGGEGQARSEEAAHNDDWADSAMYGTKAAIDRVAEAVRTAMEEVGNAFGMENPRQSSTAPGLWQPCRQEEGALEACFSPEQFKCLNVQLAGEAIDIKPSQDGLIHLLIARRDENLFLLDAANGCVTLRRNPHGVPVTEDVAPEDFQGFGGILTGIGKALRNTFREVCHTADPVYILLPTGLEQLSLLTTGGDIDLEGLQQGACAISTTTGDVDMRECLFHGKTRLNVTSGDVDVSDCFFSQGITLNATSGDVDFTGDAPVISCNNVSGDITLEGELLRVQANTTSGDIDICARGPLQAVQANTTSGDITVSVSDGNVPNLRTNTVSGDVAVHCPTSPQSAFRVSLNSVSGDLSIDNWA